MCAVKHCRRCDETKPFSEFYWDSTNQCYFSLCRRCKRQESLNYAKTDAGKAVRFKARLKHLYKLSLEQYEELVERQQGVCALCGSEPVHWRRLSVDHDHRCCPSASKSCGKCVRALLCLKCNNGVGWLENLGVDLVLAYLDQRAFDWEEAK